MALALAVLVPAAGCQKAKDKSASSASKGKPAGAAASALDIMPETTGALIGINVQKIVSSKLWQQYSPQFLGEGEGKEFAQKAKDYCGMDVTTDLDSVVFGVPADTNTENMVVLVKGKFDEAKLTKCVITASEKEEQKKVTAKTDGKVTEYTTEGEEKKVYIGWAAADTIVIVPAAMEGNRAALDAVMAGTTSAKNNKDLAAVMGNVNTSETIWGAVTATGKLKESMPGVTGDGPQPLAGWLNLAYQKELGVEVGMRFANEADAKAMVEKMNTELASAKGDPNMGAYLSSLKVEPKGSDAVMTMKLDEKQVDEVVAKVGAFLPMMMMGLAGGAGGGM